MKALFLDFDGVLNSASSMLGIGHSAHWLTPEENKFDPVSVGLINRTIEECDLKVYLITSWCTNSNQEELKKYLEEAGFNVDRLIPHIGEYAHLKRELRVLRAIEKIDIEDFVVVDDMNMTETFVDNMIHVDGNIGFKVKEYEKICTHFGKTHKIIII